MRVLLGKTRCCTGSSPRSEKTHAPGKLHKCDLIKSQHFVINYKYSESLWTAVCAQRSFLIDKLKDLPWKVFQCAEEPWESSPCTVNPVNFPKELEERLAPSGREDASPRTRGWGWGVPVRVSGRKTKEDQGLKLHQAPTFSPSDRTCEVLVCIH